MTPADIERLVGTLGVPVASLAILTIFGYKTLFPWLQDQLLWWRKAMEENTRVNQNVLAALQAITDQVQKQPNQQIAEALTKLNERMEQHNTDARAAWTDQRERLERIETMRRKTTGRR
jgi:hypothetical protein